MEDVLDPYREAPDPRRPVVCFDETPVQLVGETRIPWPAQPGKPARIGYEYRRNGTASLFVFLDAHQPRRHMKLTECKTALDFAQCIYELAEVHYRDAETVREVLDSLSRHSYGRNTDFSVPPAQIPACPLGHGAPTSGV